MNEPVAFHFLLLAAGEVLNYNPFVTAQLVQDCIQNDDAFGVRVPLQQCRLALFLLKEVGFLESVTSEKYVKFGMSDE